MSCYSGGQIIFTDSFQRISELVMAAEREFITTAFTSSFNKMGHADAIRNMAGPVSIALGAQPTLKPPKLAVVLAAYLRDTGALVSFGIAPVLAGTLPAVWLDGAKDYAKSLGLDAEFRLLPALKPIARLDQAPLFPCTDGIYRSHIHAHAGKASWLLKDFGWEAGWAYSDWQADDTLRQLGGLPHPVAMERAGMSNAMGCHYEPELLSRIQDEASLPGRARLVAMRSIYEWNPSLEDVEEEHEDSVMPLAGVYAALHWKLANGALFVVRNTLLRRLEHTDIEKGFSIRYLRAPYPDAFFHFEVPFRPKPGQGEDVSITGFYLTEQPWEAGGPSARLINISFSYNMQGEVLRFGTIDVSFYCTDESEEDLSEELKRRAESILRQAGSTNQADIDGVHEAVMLVAKILLYANMKSARRVEALERTQLLEEIKGLKGNKRDKVAHKLKRAYDAILLGPEETDEDRLAVSLAERMMPVHWRRGHYREQPFGPGRLQRKSIFIFPILVNASKANEPPGHRPYSIE